MKMKLISLLLCITLISTSMIGCGSSTDKNDRNSTGITNSGVKDDDIIFSSKSKVPDALFVTMNGETYDLSKNFHEVVGDMVKNELGVFDTKIVRNFSDAGYYETDSDKKIRMQDSDLHEKVKGVVFATFSSNFQPGMYDHIKDFAYYNYYELKSRLTLFQTGEDITYLSTEKELEKLSNYIPYHGAVRFEAVGFAAVYFDDQAVDLSKYKEDIDSFKQELEKNNELDISDPDKQWYQYGINSLVYSDDISVFDSYDPEIVLSEIAVTKALQDGVIKLKNGDIKNLCAVLYTIDGEYTDFDVFIYTDEYIFLSKEKEEKN